MILINFVVMFSTQHQDNTFVLILFLIQLKISKIFPQKTHELFGFKYNYFDVINQGFLIKEF